VTPASGQAPTVAGPYDDALHADALRVLTAWAAPDEVQEQLRGDYVAHLEAHRDGMRRSCLPDHLTAGALIVSADRTHVLLTLHAKAQAWFHMGGHCEATDATLAGAALREAVEESGVSSLRLDPVPVQLDRHEVPFCGDRGAVRHLDVRFVAVAPADAEHAVSEESLDVRWWPVDALPPDALDLPDLVEKALARLQPTSSASI
jgi:8-oxo-dGTP pyrophosphatase MutT (NUDIX family)